MCDESPDVALCLPDELLERPTVATSGREGQFGDFSVVVGRRAVGGGGHGDQP